MSTRRSNRSLVFPLLLVFLGVMFLLTNLGIVEHRIWSDIFRYWPILLILMGIDALLRRSSMSAALGTVITAAVIIVAGIVLFQLFAPDEWVRDSQAFAYPLGTAASGDIVLACQDCTMDVSGKPEASNANYLVSGYLSLRRDERLRQTVGQTAGEARFKLESNYRLPFLVWTERSISLWQVQLNQSVPLALSVSTQGTLRLDLTDVQLESADITTGDHQGTITLPRTSSPTLTISGNRLDILVPENVGVRIDGAALDDLDIPSDYVLTQDGYISPDYDAAVYRSDIVLRTRSEGIEIKPVASFMTSEIP